MAIRSNTCSRSLTYIFEIENLHYNQSSLTHNKWFFIITSVHFFLFWVNVTLKQTTKTTTTDSLLKKCICCVFPYNSETTIAIIWSVSYLWRKHTIRKITQIRTIPAPIAGTAQIPEKYIPNTAYTFMQKKNTA